MNELEATRAKLKCLEIVEGTGLEWRHVVRHVVRDSRLKIHFTTNAPLFCADEAYYEFALGVVEGKPVWKGDTLYINDIKIIADENGPHLANASWNPPAPKTIMVELPIDEVEILASICDGHIGRACKKALESAKCK